MVRISVNASYSTAGPHLLFPSRVLLNAVGGAVWGESMLETY